MADPFAAYPVAPAGTPGLTPPAPSLPDDPFAAYPVVPQPRQPEPRSASGVVESLQAGFQASAPGLAWRGKLPELVINPEHSAWWERALSGVAQIGMELPLMIGGAVAGGPAGAAVGTAVAPGAGTAAGALLGAGAGMGIVPAAIRQSLIEAYKSGEIKTSGEFWNAVREVATQAAKEGAINAVGMGLGSVAARAAGKALAPAIGQTISVPTATATIAGSDVAAQIATMATMPAALQGRLPDLQEIMDAAILVGGLSLAGVTASKITSTYLKTGKTPAEQVADAQRDPEIARDLTQPPEIENKPSILTRKQANELVNDSAFNGDLEEGLNRVFLADEGPDQTGLANVGFTADEIAALERVGMATNGVMNRQQYGMWINERSARLNNKSTMVAPEYVPPVRTEMLKIQENLFTETARLNEMETRAATTPLTDMERIEFNTLRAKVLDLENQLNTSAPELARTPTYTADQFVEARTMADQRLVELTEKAATDRLTDSERAERVFLTNSLNRPEALARHFGFEAKITVRPSPDQMDASAQKIYDDVLRMAKEADQARKDAGNEPLGDDHAQAIAALVRARIRTRAERLGVLPETLYNERPVKIADESAVLEGAAKIEQPTPAPELGPPVEVDLFGDPIQTATDAPTERMQIANLATQEVPLASLVLSKEVPQFKNAANREGVVVPLGGMFDRTGVGPIQVWERLDGTLEVISGRHRLDLARRSGEETIPAQIHREAEGFTAKQAATLDAQLNIREEQGSVADYAQYFKDAEISKDTADKLGLLARAKGRAGFAIARDASPDLLASHRAGRLTDEAALSISAAAPGSARLQALGIAAVQDGKSILYATNLMRSVDLMAAERMAAGQQGDIFGFDDSALREASAMAKKAASKQRQISEQIAAVSGASKRPELARKMGVNVEDPAAVQAKIIELKNEQYLWDNWPMYPELVAKLRDNTLKQARPLSPHATDWRDAPLDDADYVTWNEINALEHAPYVKNGVVLANSRQVPNDQAFPPVGTWRISEIKGIHGREIEQLVELPIASLRLSELDQQGRLDPTKRGDDERYAEWLKEGKRPPPVNVLQQDSGNLTVTDGHRRVLAAKLAGRETVEAWVNYAVPIPDGGRINSDPTKPFIRTGMTYEMLTGEIPNPYLDRMKLFQDEFPMLPETPAEAAARDRDAVQAAMREVNGETPTKLYQDRMKTWYRSVMGEAITNLNMKQGDAKAWLQALKGLGNKGVKAEEVKWSGIEEWLQLQEGKITKEQVQEFLANNGVKVEEVMLGNKSPEAIQLEAELARTYADKNQAFRDFLDTSEGANLSQVQRANLGWWAKEAANGDQESAAKMQAILTPDQYAAAIKWGEAENAHNAASAAAADIQQIGAPKYGSYQLPGGENYRELLLTLPEKTTASPERAEYERWAAKRMLTPNATRTEELWTQETGRAVPTPRTMTAMNADRSGNFQSSHFDQPNILAHIRFNERTDAEGKRVLFIEEIQSDWAQKGKKEGFKDQLPAGYEAKQVEGGWAIEDQEGIRIGGTHPTRLDAIASVPGERNRIPAAPFVGKTDAWVALALKRMIAYAAENGFDRVAWTRGEQQVERYTGALRKAVDVIEWTKTDKGVQLVGYKGTADNRQMAEMRTALRQIDDEINTLLGNRSVAELTQAEQQHLDNMQARRDDLVERLKPRNKVVDTTEKEDALSDAIGKAMAEKIISDPNQSGTIEGENIRIDSTGMAGFYDRIVPKVANEVLKKLGGGKVADVDFIKNEAPAGWDVAETAPGEGPTTQQGFDITQSMKDKATEGLPLFQQRDQQHRGSYDIAENLITIMGKADKSTVVHELGHSWLEEMKTDAARPDAVDQIKRDWDILRRELAIGEDGEISRASHEQFARSVERYLADGDAPSVELRGVFERFKQWLLEIYRDLRNLNVEINPELRSVLDRMLATDEEIRLARDMNIPRAYVPEATAIRAAEIVPPPAARRKIEPGIQAEQARAQPFADEIPPGPGEAPDNIHVNYAYINSPDDVKLAMQRMAEIDQANIQAQRGGTEGVKSWAEANAEQARYLNDILGGGPDTLHLFEPRDPNAPQVDARLGILKKLAVGAAKDSARLRDIVLEAGHDATVRQQLEYMGSIERARMIQAEFLGERAAVARALNALKDTTEGTGEIAKMLEVIGLGDTDGTLFQAARTPAEEQAYLKAKLDEILQNYRGKTVLDIAKLHKEIGTLKGTFKFAEEVSKATKWDMVVEGWRAGLLSGPVTHTTNLFGTGAFMAMRAPVDFLSAMIGMARGASPGLGESDRASMSEAVARITGMMGGVQDGLKLAAAAFRADDPTGKTEAYRTAIPGRAGEIIRTPLRLMSAEDALVSTMYQRGELRTLAIRQAFNENMNPGTREFADRVQQLVDNPTEDMKVAAETAATRMTFNAPLGEKGVALQLFVNKWNLQWMIPFIRTPINIAKELARMSPIAPVVGEWRADIAKGGVARDRALAEVALGTAVMGITMAYAFAGNISGSSGPDPGKNRGKAGVWQPNSILIGDTWYEYGRIQPTGTLMVLAADIAAVWDHMTEEEKDKIPKMLAIAFSNAVTNQTFLQGITNFVNAMGDPTRFAPKFLQGLAGSLVPNIIAQPTAMADPVVREVNSMVEAIESRIPGLRQNLLPSRDWLGEPRPARERLGFVLPSRTLEVSKDKVRLEAARLDISMAAPPRKTHIGKGTGKLGDVPLTPEEIDTFEKVGGEFAHQILTNVVNAPEYDKIPDMVKRRIFSNVLSASHRVAAVAALPMEKRLQYLQSITEKVAQELTAGEQ